MKKIAVITGGAGGMGLATAKILGRDHHLVICDINQQRLDEAMEALQEQGFECDAMVCDVTRCESIDALVNLATELGELACVIHTAGISPQMAGPEAILNINAIGTVNLTEAVLRVAGPGFALVNVASMAAHMAPDWIIPTRIFKLAEADPKRFLKKTVARCRILPKELYRNGMAYSISKKFVIWYSKVSAAKFGEKGARVLSVSPGTFDTEMGRLEEKSGAMKMLETAAFKRAGKPEEMAELLAFCASDKASYLTGTDILNDGGVIAGRLKH